MSNLDKNPRCNPKGNKKSEFKLKKDPKCRMQMLFGPDFTKEDIEKASPDKIGEIDDLQKLYSRTE